MTEPTTRQLVVVSGYYGFDNLGDEAILEELTNELKQLVPGDRIVVLSANPEKTAATFGVRAEERMNLLRLANLLKEARLFISGGGGLFQDVRSSGSVLFYGLQMMLAHALGTPVCVYAQGIGPLKRALSKAFAKHAFTQATALTVRDADSVKLLADWGVAAEQTADPVWSLSGKPLPESVERQLSELPAGPLVALSLREAHNFHERHLEALVNSLSGSAPRNAHILLMPLQANQDVPMLEHFASRWRAIGRECTLIDTQSLSLPSQWITLFGRCKLVVSMRLHALIMALKAGVGVVGLVYDPKVSHVLTEFEQPALILAKEPELSAWMEILANAFNDTQKLSLRAIKKAEGAKKLACQNFAMLAKILNG